MKQPVQVAIIGCGLMGQAHARACVQCGAEVRWAVDVNPERARGLPVPAGRTSTDYEDALHDPQVQAVTICLPHDLHALVAVQAARAGKHILCEKPLAATLPEADQMIEAADRAGVSLMVAENVRFDPVLRKMGELLAQGAIGQPALAQVTRECYLVRSFVEERPWFLNAKAAAGGIMMSGGVHDFETLRMLVGEVESVQALRARQRFVQMEGDDTSVALARFRNGAVGVLVESFIMKSLTTASGAEAHVLRIDGDLGSMWTSDGRTIHLFSEQPQWQTGPTLSEHLLHVKPQDSILLENEHFLACIASGAEPLTSGRSQRGTLKLVLAAYRSMETGQPVRV